MGKWISTVYSFILSRFLCQVHELIIFSKIKAEKLLKNESPICAGMEKGQDIKIKIKKAAKHYPICILKKYIFHNEFPEVFIKCLQWLTLQSRTKVRTGVIFSLILFRTIWNLYIHVTITIKDKSIYSS